jgi:hypothetical protein
LWYSINPKNTMEDNLEQNLKDEFIRIVERAAHNELKWNDYHNTVRMEIGSSRGRMALMWAAWKLGLISEDVILKPSLIQSQESVLAVGEHEKSPMYLLARQLHRRRL